MKPEITRVPLRYNGHGKKFAGNQKLVFYFEDMVFI